MTRSPDDWTPADERAVERAEVDNIPEPDPYGWQADIAAERYERWLGL